MTIGEIIKTIVTVILVLFLFFGHVRLRIKNTETGEVRQHWEFRGVFVPSSEDIDEMNK